MYYVMNSWIADFFQAGHSIKEIMDMPLEEYVFLVGILSEVRARQSGSSTPKNLRPVQKDAIKNVKNLKNK